MADEPPSISDREWLAMIVEAIDDTIDPLTMNTDLRDALIRARLHLATEPHCANCDHLRHALTTRGAIDQAKGMIMWAHEVDADTAFDMLSRESKRTNTKLTVLANWIVEGRLSPDVISRDAL